MRGSTWAPAQTVGGTRNQGTGNDGCRKRNAFNSNTILYRKGKMSKVFLFFSDLYTYSFNMNNLAYHKAAGETLTPIPLSCREEAQLWIFRAILQRIWPLMCSSFILSPHKHPQRNYHTQDPREANVSSVVHTSIPLADSLVSFLICQMKKIGSQDDAMR